MLLKVKIGKAAKKTKESLSTEAKKAKAEKKSKELFPTTAKELRTEKESLRIELMKVSMDQKKLKRCQ